MVFEMCIFTCDKALFFEIPHGSSTMLQLQTGCFLKVHLLLKLSSKHSFHLDVVELTTQPFTHEKKSGPLGEMRKGQMVQLRQNVQKRSVKRKMAGRKEN